jgi:hypothetical protein
MMTTYAYGTRIHASTPWPVFVSAPSAVFLLLACLRGRQARAITTDEVRAEMLRAPAP